MNITDVEIIVKTPHRGTRAKWLCRIKSDPAPDNYAVWNFLFAKWDERGMSAWSARAWAEQHNLLVTIRD